MSAIDERLDQEFEKIVEAVHGLELVALQQGDGFTEQRSEPAPIDEANDITFPVDPNIKAKAEAEIKTTKSDLPLVLNDQVASVYQLLFQPARSGHAGACLGAVGPLSRDDLADPEGRRRPAGPDLPGSGRIWFPAAGFVASRRSRDVAVHCPARRRFTGCTAPGGSTSARTRRSRPAPPDIT